MALTSMPLQVLKRLAARPRLRLVTDNSRLSKGLFGKQLASETHSFRGSFEPPWQQDLQCLLLFLNMVPEFVVT